MRYINALLWLSGYFLLFWADWRIGLGVFLVIGSNNYFKRVYA